MYERQARDATKLRLECATLQRTLNGYLTIQRKNLKAALVVYIQQLPDDANHAKIDWWEKLKWLRICTPGKKQSYSVCVHSRDT